jgi:[protein-PII] uridylyltransferase
VGRRIAEAVADRFQLPEEDRKVVVFLVHQHLYLSRAAFHRDASDPELWVQVTRHVGSARVLRMLYVLTAVDIMAVGPGTFNQWKSDILRDLYLSTMSLFGEADVAGDSKARLESIQQQLAEKVPNDPRVTEFLALAPAQYLSETTTEEAAEHLLFWEKRKPCDVDVWTSFNEANRTTTYTVMTDERLTDGIFHKICGGLAAHHLKVLSARIHTLADGVIIDQFTVKDPHSSGPPTPDKVERVASTLRRILNGHLSVSDALWSTRSSMFVPQRTRYVREAPRVVVDNRCSEAFTVIDVFAGDNRGLLYTLAKAIYRLGLSVWYAKIATYADEGVDVFYVLEADGKKVYRDDRVQFIEKYLLRDIERLMNDPRSMGF